MSTPALIWLAIAVFSLGITAANHDEPRTGNHSFWSQLAACALGFALLYWGGFFAQVPA